MLTFFQFTLPNFSWISFNNINALLPKLFAKLWIGLGNIFFKDLIYWLIHERHTERGRDTGRERRLPVGSQMGDSIPGPQDHALNQRQMLNHWGTQAPSLRNFIRDFSLHAYWRSFGIQVRSGANDKGRILGMPLVQNGGFIKAWGQNPRAGRVAALGLQGVADYIVASGGSKEKGDFRRIFIC